MNILTSKLNDPLLDSLIEICFSTSKNKFNLCSKFNMFCTFLFLLYIGKYDISSDELKSCKKVKAGVSNQRRNIPLIIQNVYKQT